LTRTQYLADPDFVKVDAKLRKDYNLYGFDVAEVTAQLVAGTIYGITYKTKLGDTSSF